tara:strand:+ start:230 stop:529 length:300 start_codon:yes stop_codon:yes gene_type:complete
MLKKRKAQGLSITTIIVAVIALIVLVVIVAILTGRMGAFSSGVAGVASCENACKALGMKKSETSHDEEGCKEKSNQGYQYMPGTYSDITSTDVCCCQPI